MKTINLNDIVIVSDPCYPIGTWCQFQLNNVLPGEYYVNVIRSKSCYDDNAIAALVAVHKDHIGGNIKFRTIKEANIVVDSGQAGIFSYKTYRNDEIFKDIPSKLYGTYENMMRNPDNPSGSHWFGHMTDRTLWGKDWETYDEGVVSRSGDGDGIYRLCVAKKNNQVVGIAIDYLGVKNYMLSNAINI